MDDERRDIYSGGVGPENGAGSGGFIDGKAPEGNSQEGRRGPVGEAKGQVYFIETEDGQFVKITAENPSEPQRRRLRRPAAAAYIGVAPATLDKWATERRGPPFKKAGGRVVVYDTADLDAFLAGCETGGGPEERSAIARKAGLAGGRGRKKAE